MSSCFGPEKVLAKESCWKISQIRKFITMELKYASETLFMHFFFMWVAKWSYATRQKLWNTDTGCQINVVFSLTVVFSFTFKYVLLLIAFLSLNVFWNAKKSTMSWLTCVRIFSNLVSKLLRLFSYPEFPIKASLPKFLQRAVAADCVHFLV